MTYMGGGADSSIDYYEAEARKHERERREYERERFKPVKIPAPKLAPNRGGPPIYRFDSTIDEDIEPKTRQRASVSAYLHRGNLLWFHMDGTREEMLALCRAMMAKIREITEEEDE